jgi:4-amino-4-deoxy-L-arabinose transferase-like glycosyltransferase
MRSALWVNLILLCVALVAPRMTNSSEAAAIWFAIPMALILVIGAAAAIWAYVLARRENRRPRWTAFLPLSVFLLGIAGTLALVYSDFTWSKPPTEVTPAQR